MIFPPLNHVNGLNNDFNDVVFAVYYYYAVIGKIRAQSLIDFEL